MIRKTNNKLIICGNYLEYYQYEKPIYWGFQNIQKISGSSKNEERTTLSINRARQKLYKIILSNIDEKQKYKNLFLTLTFKKNITDIKYANYEYKKFIQRFNFYLKTKIKYITVIEFQNRGAIHYHTLLFNIPYIKDLHLKITEIWKHGMTEIKPIKDIKNISAYVSKYIRKGFFDKKLSRNKAYFCSRNCTYPQEIRKKEEIDLIIKQKKNIIISRSSYPSNKKGQIIKVVYKQI